MQLTVGDDDVLAILPGHSEGRYYWNAILDHAEDKRLLILFVRKKLFLMVPHRALSEGQWVELRALIAAKRAAVSH